ncbi:MAG: response regulator transcription factor [Epsilonproteobacteria bacterium]|nr:response regulator transcription factor [Campylobacterota bacterium]
MKRKILLVEDDLELNETIGDFLKMSGFDVISVYDGEEAVIRGYEQNFDLILLDVKLPLKSGFEVAKELRKRVNTPIIFITSLDSPADVESGFLSGGDDYIKKPFLLKELKLRIDAILRRVYNNKELIELEGGFIFDVKNLELRKDNKKIHLKRKVALLLSLFLESRGRILTKEEIFERLYEYEETPNEASLRTFISNLRSILGNNSIETIKDVGYKFVG